MILGFGTYDTARHPRAGVLLDGLRARGLTVREVNHPLGLSTAERVRMLREPWRLPLLVARLVRCWLALVAGTARSRVRHGRPDVVLVGYLGHFDVVLARLLHPRATLVLDHLVFAADTALDRGARGLRVRLLHGLDRLATACADVVVVDTEEHRAMLPDPARGVVVPVGAPEAWFAPDRPVAADTGQPREGDPLRVIFFGLFTPLQGTTVLADALAAALPRAAAAGRPIEVTLVGSGQDLPAVRHRLAGVAGVHHVGWVEPARLPVLVAEHDVCLGIFSDTPKGRRVVPNKVFQGLAAGCVVVTSDTPPQRRLLGPHLELVPPADPDALAARLVALTDRDVLAAARRRARAALPAIRPAAVVEPLAGAIAGATASRRVRR